MPTPGLISTAASRTDATTTSHAHAATKTATRRATLDDFDAVNALHERCSLGTRFARYQAARRTLRLSEFDHLMRPGRSLTWVTYPEGDPSQIIATMNLVRTTDVDAAELGIMIEDPWQSRGLGTSLVQYARAQVRGFGCSSMLITTGSDNVRMLKIMRTLGAARASIHSSTVDLAVSTV